MNAREQLKASPERFRQHIRKKIFTIRVVRHKNRLPREVSGAPCPSVIKRYLE